MTDEIASGAFSKRLQELRDRGKKVPILWNHNPAATLEGMTPEQMEIALNNIMLAFERPNK